MKVLVITSYLGNKGGLGRYSSQVVKALKMLPIEVVTVTEADLLKKVFGKNKLTTLFNLVVNALKVRKLARDVDVIHAHDGWPYALYGYYAALGTSKKLFITGVGTYSVLPLKDKVRGSLLVRAYNRAHQIFCISDYVKNRIDELCRDARTSTVFMGATPLPKITDNQKRNYESEYNLHGLSPLFLTVGDIKIRKGQLDTLKALSKLKDSYPNFVYVMIGSAGDRYYIDQIISFAREQGLEKNIKIISDVYDDSVLSFFYDRCDIFMLNSNNDNDHFEGFGLVLLEAAQFGKPVIGSKGCGIESAIQNCYNGYLTEQGNHDEIYSRVLDILEKDKNLFSKNSLNFYKNFSWEKTAQSYYEHYTS